MNKPKLTHGSLFSGIGGFDLAAEWMGWENKFHCEWNPFGQKILKYYWPNAISYEDITKTDFTIHRGRIDILTGGFPCQPFSVAGKQKGTEDERHLWPEMLRAIREVKPRFVVAENVPGIVSWSDGMVFEQVQIDLESEGYEVQAYILPAASVNAPHNRSRTWFIAYSDGRRRGSWKRKRINNFGWKATKFVKEGCKIWNKHYSIGKSWFITDTNSQRCNNWSDNRKKRHFQGNEGFTKESESKWNGWKCRISKIGSIDANASIKQRHGYNKLIRGTWKAKQGKFRRVYFTKFLTNTTCIRRWRKSNWFGKSRLTDEARTISYWENFPTQSPICVGNDGFPIQLDGFTFSKFRKESIKAGGNAIVPHVAYQIFSAINEWLIFINK